MSAKLRLFIRVANRRIKAGEGIDDILKGWAALTDDEKDEIRKAVGE